MYKELLEDPNNLSFWFPYIQSVSTHGISIPRTEIVHIPEDVMWAFCSDPYDPDSEKKQKLVESFVHTNVMPAVYAISDGLCNDIFIKNGCFSNKFMFDKNCHLSFPFDEHDVLKHIFQIQYDSFCFDTSGNTEIVVREYIPAEPGTLTIYEGMPLRPEMRVFYDFTARKLLYAVNYWDWSYCHESICHIEEDAKAYENGYKEMFRLFNERMNRYIDIIDKALSSVEGLSGAWSVDFMLEEDRCWIIDMAIACRSAYYDPSKIH